MSALSRREFTGAVAGIVICFSLRPGAVLAEDNAEQLPAMLAANPRLDASIRIDPTGTVSIFTGRVELGQGNITALAQIAAEELDVNFARIRMIPVDTARSPNEGFTAGSNSMQVGGMALRDAAAEARAILVGMAATRLNMAAAALQVDDGTIRGRGDTRQLTYWQLAADSPLARAATPPITPKPPNLHHIVGHDEQRLDIPAKAMGRPAFVQDLQVPGMLHGRVPRPPSYDAQLLSLDETSVRKLPGVIAVARNGRFLGVVTQREEQAIAAREALMHAASWRVAESLPPMDSVHAYLQARPDIEVKTVSEQSAAAPAVTQTLTATYSKPYLAHASIGPSCAVAGLIDGLMTVWSHTQGPYPLRGDLAKALDMPLEKVRVIHSPGSGCYGHNGADDVALDAALLSLAAGGRTVRVQWMRDDEFAFEPYGSAMTMTARAGLSADGTIVDWQYDLWSCTCNMRPGGRDGVNLLAAWHLAKPQKHATPREIGLPAGGGDRNAVPTYAFANRKIVDHFIPDMPLRVSALRTLGGFGNVFAVESMMDEAAAAAGADPVQFRLKHLDDPRAKAVLTLAAQQAGWQPGAKGDGTRGRGVGFCRYETTKSYVALIADCVVDPASGLVRVTRVVAATDAGQIISPDGLRNQIEGGIIQGTSWTLKEQVQFDSRRITSRDWAGYPILTFNEVPEVDVLLIDHPELPPLGAGEASQGPIAAAIANAIFHATGARLRDLPFTPARVKSALGHKSIEALS
jgi:CO/xanthine dehydrogenase Mo-binding subunit